MNYYNDNDASICSWLNGLISAGLIPNGTVDGRSICDVKPADLRGFVQAHWFAGIGGWAEALRLAGWPETQPVWSASLPCQPWANCGKGLGEADERHLAPQFLALTEICRPPILFGEQVASEDALFWLDGLFFHLEKQGYTCAAANLCAAGIGAIHDRERLFWGAYSSGFRVPRLEPPKDFSVIGSWRASGAEDLQAFIDSPFVSSSRWAQPLIRATDDGLFLKRVVGCHASGNAIVPPLAAEFIQAFCESVTELEEA